MEYVNYKDIKLLILLLRLENVHLFERYLVFECLWKFPSTLLTGIYEMLELTELN